MMNLKESFRYQNFLENMLGQATDYVRTRSNCLIITRNHLMGKVDPDAADVIEAVESETPYAVDSVITFMSRLVRERETLTTAIGKAKASIGFDLDAAIETNKFRQNVGSAIRATLKFAPTKRTEQGRGYKFNAEGNQMPYYYDIEVVSEEAYDRATAKTLMRSLVAEADAVSSKIDTAMINTSVDYNPPFDVNLTFDDVMSEFVCA